MRKILFAVLMAAGIGLVGTSASAAPGAPIGNGLTTSNVVEAQYGVYRRHHRRYHRRAYRHGYYGGYYGNRGYYGNQCSRVRICDGYGYCRWRSRCY